MHGTVGRCRPSQGHRSGGEGHWGPSMEPTVDTEALATIDRVLGAYENNQGQLGEVIEELREIKLLQWSMGNHFGQLIDIMDQFVGVLRDI